MVCTGLWYHRVRLNLSTYDINGNRSRLTKDLADARGRRYQTVMRTTNVTYIGLVTRSVAIVRDCSTNVTLRERNRLLLYYPCTTTLAIGNVCACIRRINAINLPLSNVKSRHRLLNLANNLSAIANCDLTVTMNRDFRMTKDMISVIRLGLIT